MEGRYQPGDSRGWYAAVRAGVAAILDGEDSYSVIQGGPLGTAALGYDVAIVGALSFGLELQANLAGFPENGVGYQPGLDGDSSSIVYGTSRWLGFGLVGSLGI